jgi:hypothetical protein
MNAPSIRWARSDHRWHVETEGSYRINEAAPVARHSRLRFDFVISGRGTIQ